MDSIFDRPVFIFGCHKSGTSLLRALLDNHPELLCIPKEAHFFQAAGFPIDYPIRKEIGVAQSEMFTLDRYREFLQKENADGSQYSDNPGFQFDIQAFKQSFNPISGSTGLRSQFEVYMKSVISSSGLEYCGSDSVRLLEKSVENFEFFPLLDNMFPNGKFIHIVRNPYAVLYAVRRMKSESGYPAISKFIRAIHQSMTSAYRHGFLNDKYMVVKYEDLVSEPYEIMLQIADFLNIGFKDILLEPSVNGVPWRGNSVSNEQFTGVSKNSLHRWKKEINDLEIWAVSRHLASLNEKFGYSCIEGKLPLSSMKSESFRNYLRNRIKLRIQEF